MIGVSVLVAVPLRVATKPATGPLARSPTTAPPPGAGAGAACGARAARLLRAARLGALREGCVAAGRGRCCGASTVTGGSDVCASVEVGTDSANTLTANTLTAERQSVRTARRRVVG